MAFLALSESVYAAIPVLTVASDTIRRVVIYFDKEETDIDFSYKTNNHEINVLDSLLEEKINSRPKPGRVLVPGKTIKQAAI